MQDKYAGDIGDYGKFALLKEIEKAGLSLGVNWYKTKSDESEKHNDGRYLIPEKYMSCDLELSKKLYAISVGDMREIAALQNADLLKADCYYADETPSKVNRDNWQKNALRKFSNCDIVFLDPDNGLSVKSVGPRSQKSTKYVFMDEIADYIRMGKSVIFYNHRQRLKADIYFDSVRQRLESNSVIHSSDLFVVTFPKYSIRDYFIVSADEMHSQKIKQALVCLLRGPFGEKGLCRLPGVFNPLETKTCPNCGFGNPVKIVYGMPTFELAQQSECREVYIGGCCGSDNDAQWYCPDCKNQF